MNKYLTEFIGTFFLVLTVGCTVIPDRPGVIAPLAIGASLMVMVFAGGHVSGAHFNPAVTLAVWIRGKCSTADLLCYIPTQVIAGIAAAMVAMFLKEFPSVSAAVPKVPQALLAEFPYTFALCYVVV